MSGNLGGFRSSQRFALLLSAQSGDEDGGLSIAFPEGWDYRNACSQRQLAGFMDCEAAAGVNPAAQATRYINATLGGL